MTDDFQVEYILGLQRPLPECMDHALQQCCPSPSLVCCYCFMNEQTMLSLLQLPLLKPMG